MRIVFFNICFVFYLFTNCAPVMANEYEYISLRKISDESKMISINFEDRPLPLAAHWNLGEKPRGFSPNYQLQLLKNGHHILPWFHLSAPNSLAFLFYYKEAIQFAAKFNLPISFVGTQWENLLSTDNKYFGLPFDLNPNVVLTDGAVIKKVSPFGPTELWKEVGMKWTAQPLLSKLQEWYPSPPLILFVSNNEHPKLAWSDVGNSLHYMKHYGSGKNDEFKRKIVGDGWVNRYGALLGGMRDGLSAPSWKTNSRFIGYNAFPDGSFWRWGGWPKYALHVPGRFEPWSHVWDGASIPYYTHDWDPSVDFTAWSPQIRAMNLVFLLEDVYKRNPDYWFELSIWDGSQPKRPETDKRRYYASIGQEYTPERYGGMVQFGMWLLRPRVVREFRNWTETVMDTEPYFMKILDAVDKIYHNKILEKFWRKGELVANRNGQHPHQSGVPEEYKNRDRWFLLDTNLDPKKPWTLETEIPVFSLALSLGAKPAREWLVYAFAPLVDERDVRVQIPGYKQVAITAGKAGHFYHVQEQAKTAQRIE